MKIYYNKKRKHLFLANYDDNVSNPDVTNKIAVHCPTQEDVEFVTNGQDNGWVKRGTQYKETLPDIYVNLDSMKWVNSESILFIEYHIITIEQFKQLYNMTKVTILGDQPAKTEPKKIEFKHYWNKQNELVSVDDGSNLIWDFIELVSNNYRGTGFDLIFCYDEGHRNNKTGNCIFLGHFNDGVV